ncbi:DEAD/DEAH box helicase family protein [Ignavibacterium album]|uniref:DEAD/DEAH box helicase family protein n=1 Tax=Ignavibacterium album TaxID=591197 RepID=UPI0035B71B20
MALHPKFPKSPYEILDPSIRWFPADEDLREKSYDKLLPPLVAKLRTKVKEWRDSNYAGSSQTSLTLLKWWFQTDHPLPNANGSFTNFQYYFAQREAIETIIYLYEIAKVKDKYDLIRFDSSGAVSTNMFDEDWKRFVIKMATGSGKTKVLSLVLAWSYFHKLYEEDSTLARNFLLITPNIIVLDRIRRDFDGLKIFYEDPIIPENGYEGHNWQDDFQLTVHIQDEIGIIRKTGNLFISNIHRVFESNYKEPSFTDDDTTDYFLGRKPSGATTDSKIDLGDVVRDLDELVVLNDEAHHIHDPSLAWFKSIQDINNHLKMKGSEISLQVDATATPRHNNGAIFVQTISDYPLVEAIHQNIVKHPVLPDAASRAKLMEKQSSRFTEKYEDYLHLGYLEWKKVYDEHIKAGKKAVLFIMTDDTKNCDEVAEYLEEKYPEFKDNILVIHTKNNGEISEASSGKSLEELKKLRDEANTIDKIYNKNKVIVSVLMLKEGWDVRNVTTIVGLRAYTSPSNILPEQTLGRGLRRMYSDEELEYEEVSVVGTDAFMDFVESIKSEGVEIERKAMGSGTPPKSPLIIEVDSENKKKNTSELDIEIPILSPRIHREYKNLSELDVSKFDHKKISPLVYNHEELREIVFKDITNNKISHTTVLDTVHSVNYQSVIGFFTQIIMRDLRLVGGFDVLFGKVKDFIQNYLFTRAVDLNNPNTIRNLSELEANKTIVETFKKKINELTVVDKGEAEIKDYIKISQVRPFVVKDQKYITPRKSLFNRIVGDSGFELKFASFLDECDDIISYIKNYYAVHFKIDYITADGSPSNYYPDFIIKYKENEIYIVETKGREDLDDPLKIIRLEQWCEDINKLGGKAKYNWLYVKEDVFIQYQLKSFIELLKIFKK